MPWVMHSAYVLFAVVILLSQATTAAPPPGVPVVRIGRTVSQLGFYALEAQPVINGVRFWYEWLNSTSNLIFRNNDTDYYLQLIEYNDASDSQLVDILYRDMTTFDNVVATFGPWSTALTLPAIKRTNTTNTPIIFTAGAASFYTSGYQHSFGMFVTGLERGIPCFNLYQTLGAKSAVIIASTDPFQQSLLVPVASRLISVQINVLFNQTVAIGTTDFVDLAELVVAQNPDVVICLLESALYAPFLRDLRMVQKSSTKPPIIFNSNGGAVSGSYDLLDFEDFKWALDQVYGATQWSPYLQFVDAIFGSTQQFAQQYQTRFGYQPDFSDALAVMSGFVMLDALQRTATFASADIIEALRATNFPESIVGPVAFLPSGKINSTGLCVQLLPPQNQTLRGTKTRVMLPVAPTNLAIAQPVYPITVFRPPGPKYTKKQKVGIIVGSTVAGVVVFAVLLSAAIYVFNRHYHVLFFQKGGVPKEAADW